jgi:hypothetical protein
VKCNVYPVKFEARKYFTREGVYFTEGINDSEANDAEVKPKSILRDRRERMTFAKLTFDVSVSEQMTRALASI